MYESVWDMSRQRSDEVIQKAEMVTIGELVRLTGIRYSTIKYYTEEGFVPFEQDEAKLTRRYRRKAAVQRLNEIKDMREAGRTIPQIREALKRKEGWNTPPGDM